MSSTYIFGVLGIDFADAIRRYLRLQCLGRPRDTILDPAYKAACMISNGTSDICMSGGLCKAKIGRNSLSTVARILLLCA